MRFLSMRSSAGLRCAGILLLSVVLAAPVRAERGGDWSLSPLASGKRWRLEMRTSQDGWRSSRSIDPAIGTLDGLSPGALETPGAELRFRIVRDAGTLHFDGRAERGNGAGRWRYAADPGFTAKMQRRGYPAPTADQQFRLAWANIGVAEMDELDSQGYRRPAIGTLVRMGEHGVDLAYLRGMHARGHRAATVEALIQLRDHGVDPEFIDGLKAAGLEDLDTSRLIRLRDHGVDGDFISALARHGLEGLDADQLVRLRDHGVDAEFVAGYRRLGVALDPEQLVELRDHGVDPRFAREMAEAGFPNLSTEDLRRARDHGVSAAYARRALAKHRNLSIDEVIEFKDRGTRF